MDKYHDKKGVKKDPTGSFLELLNDQDNYHDVGCRCLRVDKTFSLLMSLDYRFTDLSSKYLQRDLLHKKGE